MAEAKKSEGHTEPLLPVVGDDAQIEGGEEEQTFNKLGCVNGVYVPCLLNILGAVLFLRIGYAVGYAGIMFTILIFALSFTTTVMTALSFSSIVTNGRMRAGGPYYMIARSIGPAYGGATGLMFWMCYVFNCAFNATAFVEDIQHTAISHGVDWQPWCFPVLYHTTLLVLFIIAWVGAGCFAKVNIGLFVILIFGIACTFFSLLFETHNGSEGKIISNRVINCYSDVDTIMDTSDIWYKDHTINGTYYGPFGMAPDGSGESLLVSNLWPWRDVGSNATSDARMEVRGWDRLNDLNTITALIFTSTCGVLEGANLSGDLKDPAKALPKGTLWAQFTAFVVYIAFAILLAMSFDRDTLRCDYFVLQETVFFEYIVVTAMGMATLSTSLGALFGGARKLQAMAKDSLYPFVHPFSFGTKHGDEPRYAVAITYVISNFIGYIGGSAVNGIAFFVTDFFLTGYLFVCISALLLQCTGAPNWRPTWKVRHWSIALLGLILSLSMMWYLGWAYAFITLLTWVTIFIILTIFGGEKRWGNIFEALSIRCIFPCLRGLRERGENAKFWRSRVVLLAEKPDMPSLRWCDGVCRPDGMFMIATTVPGTRLTEEARRQEAVHPAVKGMLREHQFLHPQSVARASVMWLSKHQKLRAFAAVGTGSDSVEAYTSVVASAGVGALAPRTVAIPFGSNVADDAQALHRRIREYISVDKSTSAGQNFLSKQPDFVPTPESIKAAKWKRWKWGAWQEDPERGSVPSPIEGWSFQDDIAEHNSGLRMQGVDQMELLTRIHAMENNLLLLVGVDKAEKMFTSKRDPRPVDADGIRMKLTPYQPGDHNPEGYRIGWVCDNCNRRSVVEARTDPAFEAARFFSPGTSVDYRVKCAAKITREQNAGKPLTVDVWVFGMPEYNLKDNYWIPSGTLALQLQYAYLTLEYFKELHPRKAEQIELRVIQMFVPDATSEEDEDAQVQEAVNNMMTAVAERVRLPLTRDNMIAIPVDAEPTFGEGLSDFIFQYSVNTVMSVLPLPVPFPAYDDLRTMADNMDSAVFCAKGEPCGVLSIEI